MGHYEDALASLQEARATLTREGMPLYAAVCDREMACVWAQLEKWPQALEALTLARARLDEEGLSVDVALCDLIAGDIELRLGNTRRADSFCRAALPVLHPAFPDTERSRAGFPCRAPRPRFL